MVNYLRPIFVVRYRWGQAKGLQEICVPFGNIFLTFGTIFVTFGTIFVTFETIFVTFGTISGPLKDMYWHFGSIFG